MLVLNKIYHLFACAEKIQILFLKRNLNQYLGMLNITAYYCSNFKCYPEMRYSLKRNSNFNNKFWLSRAPKNGRGRIFLFSWPRRWCIICERHGRTPTPGIFHLKGKYSNSPLTFSNWLPFWFTSFARGRFKAVGSREKKHLCFIFIDGDLWEQLFIQRRFGRPF